MVNLTSSTSDPSIYTELVWVIALFAATALLREAIGELCVHVIARHLLLSKDSDWIDGDWIDVFNSCSNGGRALGFGAAWRMNILFKQKQQQQQQQEGGGGGQGGGGGGGQEVRVDHRRFFLLRLATCAPLLIWVIGTPIKLIAVSAIRGGIINYISASQALGLGIFWIAMGVAVKAAVMMFEWRLNRRTAPPFIFNARREFQQRFRRIQGIYDIQRDVGGEGGGLAKLGIRVARSQALPQTPATKDTIGTSVNVHNTFIPTTATIQLAFEFRE